MSRAYCNSCHRPQVSCICHLFRSISNEIHVVILQHPSEVKQAKGTVTLLAHSLTSSQVFIGEHFANDELLQTTLKKYHGQTAVIYPSEHAKTISDENNCAVNNGAIRCIILLDGTWKKAYRLFMLNEFLQQLPHLVLPLNFESRYNIRVTKKLGALSTLEACCHALTLLEQAPQKYDELLASFEQFNQLHLSFKSAQK